MSANSFRNALSSQRKTHRERAQPKSRKKFGLLEKKKDYKERSKDFHRKEDKITELKGKAAFRNPDEFYFGMNSAKTKDGVHVLERKTAKLHTASALKNMNTEDIAYLNVQASKEGRKIEQLQSGLHCLDGQLRNKHVIFCETKEKIAEFTPAKHFDTAEELIGRTFNRPRTSTLAQQPILGEADKVSIAKTEKARLARYKELQERMTRKRKMDDALQDLQLSRNLMGKGSRRKITVENKFGEVDEKKTIYTWKTQRRR